MKTNLYRLVSFYIFILLLTVSCQNQDEMFFDPSAKAPVIGKISLDKEKLQYGGEVTLKVEVTDADALSHVEIRLIANQAVLYSKLLPGYNQKTLNVEEEIVVPFGRLCGEQMASLEIVATNKNVKTVGQVYELPLERPVFEQLYLVVGETGAEVILRRDNTDPLAPYLYKAAVDLPNNTNVFIYSQLGKKGMVWGFDAGTNTCELDSSRPISLCDSQSTEEKVKEVVFDAFSFEISPLKKEMTVNDVVFMLYKKDASDNDFVSNAFRAQNVALTNGEEVKTELIDLTTLKFDPDFFKLEGDKLTYIGQTGNATLYMNTLFNFVFVENAENPLTTNLSYPEVLFVNGWGIGRPELWSYNPDWDFNNAVLFRKVSEDATQTIYTQTVIISKWVQFKFYNQKDWGGEFSCPTIVFEDDNFKAVEEDGKPGNYNLSTSLGDDTSYKSAVAKITFTVPKSGNTTRFQSAILVESDQD